MAGFRRLSGEIVYSGPGVTVGSYTYETPDGDTMLREIVHAHEGSVVVLPYTAEGVVLIRQFRAAVGGVLYELPAGKRDVPGEDPVETARRECIEEVGYVPGRLSLLTTFYNTPGYSDERTWLYLAEDLTPVDAEPQGPEERNAEIVHVPLDSALDLIESGEIEDAKTMIGLYAVSRRWR